MVDDPFANNTRSQDFRFVYANAFGIQLAGGDLIIKFGIAKDPTARTAGNEEQVAVALNLTSMKTLSQILDILVKNVEEQMGGPIPTGDANLESLIVNKPAKK